MLFHQPKLKRLICSFLIFFYSQSVQDCLEGACLHTQACGRTKIIERDPGRSRGMPEVGKEGKIQLSLSLIGWGERCLLKKVLLLSSQQTSPIRS